MPNQLDRFGESIRKDITETQHNTRRIAANLPLIERKLDVIAGDSSYRMDFPLTEKSHSVKLNVQVRPDNCCDCIPGAEPAKRYTVAFADYFWDTTLEKIAGFGGMYSYPPHAWQNGVDYPAHYKSPVETDGSITNVWFAWEGYPFFYPTVTNTFGYGGYTARVDAATGGIVIPTNGVYSMIFRNRAGGSTTNTSHIVASIKRLPKDAEDVYENWQTISRKIYSIDRKNICTYTFKAWADMWGLIYDSKDNIEVGGDIFVKICASYAQNIGFGPTVIERLGGLYIAVYAYCFPLNGGDIVAGWLQATDVNSWQPAELSPDELANGTMIDLIGLGFGAITGVVRDENGQPIEGATVSLVGPSPTGTTNAQTLTNDEGRYTFYELTPGILWTLTASKNNYTSETRQIQTIFNTLVELDFRLVHL